MTTNQDSESQDGGKKSELWETVKVVVQALLIALVLRTFLFQPFNIPSGSMMNSLLVGDYLFVSKYAYGYSRYSFPLNIVPLEGRVWSAEPERGDIAVFRLPSDPSTDYIKRVIGLPGDQVQVLDGVVLINGTPVERERVDDFVEQSANGREVAIPRYVEILPNGVSYSTLDLGPSLFDNTKVYEVPEGHYFMMGDNRDNSTDSRASVGFVPFENFVGRAEIIFFSIKPTASPWMIWRWPSDVRIDRLLQSLR